MHLVGVILLIWTAVAVVVGLVIGAGIRRLDQGQPCAPPSRPFTLDPTHQVNPAGRRSPDPDPAPRDQT